MDAQDPQSTTLKLKKPRFCKIENIKAGRHCYNVYIKNLEKRDVTKYNGETIKMAEGTVGDETGSAEFRFVGDWIDKLSEGRVIAIRNGRANVIKEYLRLEIDIFGKVSVEPDYQIETVNETNNISKVAYVKKSKNTREDSHEDEQSNHENTPEEYQRS